MKNNFFYHSREYYTVFILRVVGNFLIFSSVFFIGKTFYQPVAAEVRYFIDARANKKYVVAEKSEDAKVIAKKAESMPKQGSLAQALDIKPVEAIVPVDTNFGIVIPKIAANSRVIGNVDAGDENEYLQSLSLGVAHARGTAFPGEGGHIFLFAHSTDYIWNVGTYNAVFYLLYKLEKGDEINLFFEGKRNLYKVTGTQVVDPSEVEYLTRKTPNETLTLQTCWPPGTTLKRLLVFAEPVVR